MFKEYESRPIKRRAFKINTAPVTKTEVESQYVHQGVTFVAYEEPKVGDYIVRLTLEDTYHVSSCVFKDRNIVPEGD